jgi:hypothetical protein
VKLLRLAESHVANEMAMEDVLYGSPPPRRGISAPPSSRSRSSPPSAPPAVNEGEAESSADGGE